MLDKENVRKTVKIIAEQSKTDPVRAHEMEDVLFIDLLRWIKGQEGTPTYIQEVIREALLTRYLTFPRKCV